MKRKSTILLVFVLLIVLVASLVLVACGDKNDDNQQNQTVYHTVTFQGEGFDAFTQPVEDGATIMQPQNPTREGYTFVSWVLSAQSTPFDFSTPITQDITLVAVWRENGALGSEENPYIIASADDLLDFADRLNDIENEVDDPLYYQAHFRLDADIDMSGEHYISAFQNRVLEEDGYTPAIRGFMGEFDGNGHTISNLTIDKTLRSTVYYVGLFGLTYKANIHDLTLSNIEYSLESSSSVDSVGAYLGGVVGLAELTSFTNVRVEGQFVTRVLPVNSIILGGLAGQLSLPSDGNSYIVYVENCHVNLTNVIAKYDDGEASALDAASLGGLFGSVYNYIGAVAIINSSTTGALKGGEWSGGLIGSVSGDNVSIINCASHTNITTSESDVSYAGGLVGMSSYNTLIMDSVATGTIKGSKSPSAYKSYAGGIIGYAFEDDYEYFYEPGVVVVNCYYSGNVRTYDKLNDAGTKIDREAITLDWAIDTLKWDAEVWAVDGDKLVPTQTRTIEIMDDVTVTFVSNDAIISSETRTPTEFEHYALLLGLEGLDHDKENGLLFFDWYMADGVRYRYFMPLIKDLTLTAKWQDVSDIVGVYTGYGAYGEGIDGGIFWLKKDGTLQWIQNSTLGGEYTFNGKNIVVTMHTSLGEFSGTIVGDTLSFSIEYGMSATVPFTFTKTDLRYFGDYYAENGDMITFSTNTFSYQSSSLNEGGYISGSFTEDGNTLTCSGRITDAYFQNMTITLNSDGSLTVNATGKNSVASLNNVVFRKLDAPNYEGQPFVGEWYVAYQNTSINNVANSNIYTVVLQADGIAVFKSEHSDTQGTYYVFGNTVKFTIEGNTSTFTFDEEEDIMYGSLNRGPKRYGIMARVSAGELVTYAVDLDIDTTLYLVGGEKVYFVKDRVYQEDPQITYDTLEHGGRVTINGADYRVVYSIDPSYTSSRGFNLEPIGLEEGVYTYEGATLTLDGIGGLIGADGDYWMLDEDTVFIIFADDTMLGFDYKQAKANGGVITEKPTDGYQGVWYLDDTVTDYYEGTSTLYTPYYKIYVTGYGYACHFYYSRILEDFKMSWEDPGWVAMQYTARGAHVAFNAYHEGDIYFFYNNKMIYTDAYYKSGQIYYAPDYDGPLELPTFDESHAGSYNGELSNGTAVVLNLKADLTGSYRGIAFSAMYDGVDVVFFEISGVVYRFNLSTNVLTYGQESVQLSRGGVVTEVIPSSIAGTWTGTWSGYGVTNIGPVVVQTNGTVTFHGITFDSVNFNSQTNTVTCTAKVGGEDYTLTLVYNVNSGTISASESFTYDYETYNRTATLTK